MDAKDRTGGPAVASTANGRSHKCATCGKFIKAHMEYCLACGEVQQQLRSWKTVADLLKVKLENAYDRANELEIARHVAIMKLPLVPGWVWALLGFLGGLLVAGLGLHR